MGIDILLQHLSIFITDGKGFRIGLLLNKFFLLNLCNFTHMFWHQTLLYVIRIQFRLPLTEQLSHINKHRILHNVLCTSWKSIFYFILLQILSFMAACTCRQSVMVIGTLSLT
jgi:hypothetical protein